MLSYLIIFCLAYRSLPSECAFAGAGARTGASAADAAGPPSSTAASSHRYIDVLAGVERWTSAVMWGSWLAVFRVLGTNGSREPLYCGGGGCELMHAMMRLNGAMQHC